MNSVVGVYHAIGDTLARFIPRKEKRTEGRYSYGLNDKLPAEQIELIASNPTALRCVLKIAEYITARGFADETLNDFPVTKNKTARKLLAETAIQYAMFECVNWFIARKPDGAIASADIHPYEMTRRNLDGGLSYNPTLLSGNEKNSWVIYPCFSKERKITPGYKGELLYEWNRTPIAYNHPIATWLAGEHTIKTGSELAVMGLELVENGFMPSAILTYIGNLDNKEKDENGLTQRGRFEKNLEKWTSKSKDATTGKSTRHSVMVLTAETKEQVADLQTFDIEEIISGSIEKQEAVDKDTCRVFNVNPTLLNWESTTFFSNGDAIKNLKSSMADSVLVAQNLIKECFEKVFPDKNWDLTTLDPYKSIVEKTEDQKSLDIINSMTPQIGAEVVRNMPKKVLLRMVGIKPEDIPEEPTIPNEA